RLHSIHGQRPDRVDRQGVERILGGDHRLLHIAFRAHASIDSLAVLAAPKRFRGVPARSRTVRRQPPPPRRTVRPAQFSALITAAPPDRPCPSAEFPPRMAGAGTAVLPATGPGAELALAAGSRSTAAASRYGRRRRSLLGHEQRERAGGGRPLENDLED